MNTKKKLVFATNNAHKLEEARQILGDRFEIVSLAELGCHEDIPETAATLEGNALIKARFIHERYGCDCFADDTGLMVDALGGAPGVYSARYAGEHCSAEANMRKLLEEMKDADHRDAHFSTVIALILDNEEHTFEGRVDGTIAREKHGDSGFGYDPVFIEEESGKAFAEMTPDEKNAVSHRGRALARLSNFIGMLIVALLFGFAGAQDVRAEEWRIHSSYDGQMERIIPTADKVYFLGTAQKYTLGDQRVGQLYGQLYCYDIEDGEMSLLNSANLLSGNIVKAAAYNYESKYLAVALDGGVVNLIRNDGTVEYIPGLSIADSSLEKNINDITFDEANHRIYLATNFGYVVINERLNEIETSRIYNKQILSCAMFAGRLWLATKEGLFVGAPNASKFEEFTPVAGLTAVYRIFPLAGKQLYVYQGENWNHRLGVVENPASASPSIRTLNVGLNGFNCSRDYGVAVSPSRVEVYGAEASAVKYSTPADYNAAVAASYNGRDFWFSNVRRGISCLKAPQEASGKWTVLIDQFLPDACNAFMSMSMAEHPDYGILVRNHGYEVPFADNMSGSYDLISAYNGGRWMPMSTTYRVADGLLIDNPWGAAIDPRNSDHIYCGSVRSGLFRLDLKNPEKSLQFSKTTDIYGNQKRGGHVAVVPDNPAGTWAEQCVFAAPAFDTKANLWTMYVDPVAGLSNQVGNRLILCVWSPEARQATTSSASYTPWTRLEIADYPVGNLPRVLPLTTGKSANLVLAHGGVNTSPLIIYDHAGTVNNPADDRHVSMKNISDQDGETLTLNTIYSWWEDPQTGLVWIGYNGGLFTFNPVEAFANPTSVRRIKVPRNDGTNLADYLLNNVPVNCITADASGRKWFATQGAGLVCTSADGRTIYETYTSDNSPLPSNVVYAIAYSRSGNSLMVSTDQGLCEILFSGAANGASDSDVRCWPNPVRPDYYGAVTIDGLPEEAMVKIVDAAGNLVKECGAASSGKVEWNVTNSFSKRVPGGVYFVVASAGPNSEAYDKVGKILVVE